MWSVSIDDDIKNGNFKPIYLLFGKELYLRNQYRDKLKNAIGAGDMNTTCYYGKSVNPATVIDQAETLPFLAEKRLIVLEDTGFAKQSCTELADYIGQIPETTIIIMVETEVDKRNSVYKAAKSHGSVIDFAPLENDDLKKWILAKIKKEGKAITSGAYNMLLERAGGDMQRLSSEIEKLVCYTEGRSEISADDVDKMCVKQTEIKIFDMIRYVATGNQKEALNIYYELLAAREPAMRTLYNLGKQFNQLLMVKQLHQEGLSTTIIAEKMKLRDFIVNNLLRQSERFTERELNDAIRECVAYEEAVKTGKLEENMSVELFIIKYSANERSRR